MAHDIQQQVSKFVTHLGLTNSFDTWHGTDLVTSTTLCYVCVHCSGTKNVGKEIKKITQGRKRDRNKRWFPELSDKREYW